MDLKRLSCQACRGAKPCLGGGDLLCYKRNPLPSRLAGIVDTYGSIRFVVTHRKQLEHHKRHDELLIVVPRLVVHEPIAWNHIPVVIKRIELTVQKWIEENSPNEEWAQEAVRMYRLRCLENPQRSLDLEAVAL